MEELRRRIQLVKSIGAKSFTTGREEFDQDIVFLQLRKVLELIAFASLIANKEKYEAEYKRFATQWRAQRLLEDLEKIHPNFYPMPIAPPEKLESGVKHVTYIADGFMTKDEFPLLYDSCAVMLHSRNPYSTDDPIIRMRYSVKDWVARIQKLLGLHMMHLFNGEKLIVSVPAEGPVQAWAASPIRG
jgi:hypothetical protein